MSAHVGTDTLRARFARNLSATYEREVPAYTDLLEVSAAVNDAVLAERGTSALRLGGHRRVTAERHGAIRVGTATEIAQVARVFGALGMAPVGFYDLRDAAGAVPVVSTAFRPVDEGALEANPFRMFTSVLVTDDRRFFDPDLTAELDAFLARRELFGPRLLALADRAEADGGLDADDAATFLDLAVDAFALSPAPLDRAWYRRLEAVSAVAADIGGVSSTHLNHLTPRVLDIDALYAGMARRGITMIDEIQGPPRWAGPDVLLRQTSFRALAEPRAVVDAAGVVSAEALRVRFGEVEQRGVALTPRGRDRHDALVAATDERCRHDPSRPRPEHARAVWDEGMPARERDLAVADLAYYRFRAAAAPPPGEPPTGLAALLDGGWVHAEPIVYEDFLPRSAAGIFASNLDDAGRRDDAVTGSERTAGWLAGVLDRSLHDPFALYDAQRRRSLDDLAVRLGLPPVPAPDHPEVRA